MAILKIERLPSEIATGRVIKMYFTPTSNEVEHSLHLLIDGSIKQHSHPDNDGISEGYRFYNLETRKFSEWEVVGAGMQKKAHKVPFSRGLRIVEGIKRKGGPEAWPELNNT